MRKFKCKGLQESATHFWSPFFTVGKVYEEVPEHCRELGEEMLRDGILKLVDDEGDSLYVDCDQFEEVPATGQNVSEELWKQYRRKGFSEMRPYIAGEDLSGVSVSPEDIPELDMGMIARNPDNHKDQWYVNRQYFEENLEEI